MLKKTQSIYNNLLKILGCRKPMQAECRHRLRSGLMGSYWANWDQTGSNEVEQGPNKANHVKQGPSSQTWPSWALNKV